MFENLLYQNRIKDRLISDIQSQSLPQSLLFSGPQYSGKNTAAMELARVLNCQKETGDWDCSCHSCNSQRLLIHGDVLFLGRSEFSLEVKAALNLLKRRDAPASRYFLIRSIRKLLRRFDPVLWEGEEKKVSKAQNPVETLTQFLLDIDPARELEEAVKKDFDSIIKPVLELEKMVPLTIPIHQIRRVTHWSHLASQGQNSKKVVILDRAEQMQEGARNALLKLLEEPPKSVYMILLSSRKGRILPTVLSRLRRYDFAGRDKEAAMAIQSRIFREEEPLENLRQYFHQHRLSLDSGRGPEQFLLALMEGEKHFPQHLFENYQKDELPLFFQELMEKLREWLHNGDEEELPSLPLTTLEKWNRTIGQAYQGMESLNLSALLLLEDLFYRLRAQK